MRPYKITDDIYWVGAVDWNTIDFHGYSLARLGTTYNAYLFLGDKVTLFDTVKDSYRKAFMESISQVIDLDKIDIVVSNHLELDHSGCLADIVEAAKPEKIICSKMGKKVMGRYFPQSADWPVETMSTGDTLDLGNRRIKFLEMKMVHWPDSMASYIPEEKILITNDAFGQNWAATERWADEVDRTLLEQKMSEYWANIVNPFAANVKKVVQAIEEQNLEIDMILPDHGFMFRGDDVQFAINTYKEYVEEKPANRAVVVFDTMWHSTEQMAEAVAEGLHEEGVSVRVMHLKSFHHSDVMSEVFKAGAVCVGSPTHNNGIMPLVADMLTYMKGLKPKNKVAAGFGSYGWSGESMKVITEWLESMNLEVVEGVRLNYGPADDLESCRELGRNVGKALKSKL